MATVEMRPRLAVASDREGVSACVNAAYTPYIARMGVTPAPMLADDTDLIARGLVYVLEREDAIVGVLVIEPKPGYLFLENVAVHPDAQGLGFGRRLLVFAEEQARAAGLPEIRLYTNELMTENLALYPRVGYEETERRSEDGYRRVFMRKRL